MHYSVLNSDPVREVCKDICFGMYAFCRGKVERIIYYKIYLVSENILTYNLFP